MPLYKLIVAYDGTRFHGFQRQIDNLAMMERMKDKLLLAATRPKKRPHYDLAGPNTGVRKGCNISIQEILEMVLLEMFPTLSVQDLAFKFAGRTDKGVHARGQVCTVQLPLSIDAGNEEGSLHSQAVECNNYVLNRADFNYDATCWKLRKDMNSRLPIDISVHHVSCLSLGEDGNSVLDPRRDVQRKQYTYTVRYRRKSSSDHPNAPDMIDGSGPHSMRTAFDSPCLWVVPWALRDEQMPWLCQHFAGRERDYHHFIHKADRGKYDSTLFTIERMEFEILNVTIEHIHVSSQSPLLASQPDDQERDSLDDTIIGIPATTPSGPRSSSILSSEIVTGRFIFEAKSFRRTMLRNIVGYCMDVCRNAVGAPSMESVFHVRHSEAVIIHAAPASGLCLEWVKY
jgi:tRNA pseudouridine(38-40) synthase